MQIRKERISKIYDLHWITPSQYRIINFWYVYIIKRFNQNSTKGSGTESPCRQTHGGLI